MRTSLQALKIANEINKIKLHNSLVFSATVKQILDDWHVDVYEKYKDNYSSMLLFHNHINAYCILNNHSFMIFIGPDNHPCYRIR